MMGKKTPGGTTRPMLRWHGGKWVLGPWIMDHFPTHRTYVEPFGGGGSVLLRKVPSYAEVYNDLDQDVVNLFRVVRHRGADLREVLRLTPFSREEFNQSYETTADPIERARRLVIRSYMGYGSDGCNMEVKTGFRSNSNRSGTTPAHDWANYPDALDHAIERLRGVVIENRDYRLIIDQHDNPETLFYFDPPYLPHTRSQKAKKGGKQYHGYVHELTYEQHAELLRLICKLEGMAVISGYPDPLYDRMLKGWARFERVAMADGARKRVEVLWLNPACSVRLERERTAPQQDCMLEGMTNV